MAPLAGLGEIDALIQQQWGQGEGRFQIGQEIGLLQQPLTKLKERTDEGGVVEVEKSSKQPFRIQKD